MKEKNNYLQTIVVIFLLILSLPLFYLLFTKVLLPWGWKEESVEKKEAVSELYSKQEIERTL